MTAAERLPLIRGLLSGLPGPLGNGEMLVWVSEGTAESVPDHVFALIDGAHEPLRHWGRGGFQEDVPADVPDLMRKLSEIDAVKAAEVMTHITSTTLAYSLSGRYDQPKARELSKALIGLLGPGARWWTNAGWLTLAPARNWNPLTAHSMDAAMVGFGGGVIVTVLVVDEDLSRPSPARPSGALWRGVGLGLRCRQRRGGIVRALPGLVACHWP